jgi:hypothetical protein
MVMRITDTEVEPDSPLVSDLHRRLETTKSTPGTDARDGGRFVSFDAYRAHPRLGLTGQGRVVTVALCCFAVGVLGARGTNRSSRLTYIAWALLVGASSVVLMVAQPSGPGSVGVLFGVLMVARRLPGRAGVPLSVAAFLILAVIDAIPGRAPASRCWARLAPSMGCSCCPAGWG